MPSFNTSLRAPAKSDSGERTGALGLMDKTDPSVKLDLTAAPKDFRGFNKASPLLGGAGETAAFSWRRSSATSSASSAANGENRSRTYCRSRIQRRRRHTSINHDE